MLGRIEGALIQRHRWLASEEPAISVWLALRDAVAGIADYRLMPKLDAPATPEAILTAIEDIRVRDEATYKTPAGV